MAVDTQWHPAIASVVANHAQQMRAFEEEQKKAVGAVLEEIIQIVGFKPTPPYDYPLFQSIYSVPRLLDHIRAIVAQNNAPTDDELDEDVKNDPVPVLPDDPPAEDDAETSPEPPVEGEPT